MNRPHPLQRLGLTRPRHHEPQRPEQRMCPCRYGLSLGATDGQGHTVCPICGSKVPVTESANGVFVVKEHPFIVAEERSA